MLKAIVISLFAVMAIVAWWRPRAGLAFLWFAIWLYPVKGMYGLLPLDIRLSDVWVVYMAVIALAMTGLAAWRNRAVRLAALWFLAILAGDVSGWFLGESVSPTPFLKDALKALYVPCTAFTFAAFVHDGRDLRRQMTWLAAAAAAAGILGILMVHFPLDLDAFLIPKEKLAWQPEVIANAELVYRRAKGALGTPGLAQIVMTGLLVALSVAMERFSVFVKTVHILLAWVCYVALIYTVSRGAITAVAVALLWSIAAVRGRGHVLAFAATGVTLVFAFTPLLERLALRFSGEEGGVSEYMLGLGIRWEEVRPFVTRFHPSYLLFGRGMPGSASTTHNAYIGAFVYGGMLGVAVLIASIVVGWRAGWRLVGGWDPLTRATGAFLCTLVVAYTVYGFSAENFQATVPMQVYFAAVVIAINRGRQVPSPVAARAVAERAGRAAAGVPMARGGPR